MKLFRKLFWVSVGVGLGVYGYAKFRAYARAHTPKAAATFLMGPELTDSEAMVSTARSLASEFTQAQQAREAELTRRFTHREEQWDAEHGLGRQGD